MKIALVADEDPGWGGIGTYSGVMAAALRDLGHDAHLILRGWEEPVTERLDGVPTHRVVVPEPSWRRGTVAVLSRLYTARESALFARGVAQVVARLHPDAVEAPEFHAPGVIVGLQRWRAGPGLVVRLHAPSFLAAQLGGERLELDHRAGELLEALSARCARLVTAPSQAIAALVARRWRLRGDTIRVVPNPIDHERFAPGRPELVVPGRIVTVGRLERAKGQDVLLGALPAVAQAAPDAHVWLVGDDGGLESALRARARELGVSERVTFVGSRERHQLPELLRTAAVCAVPSRFETFPYTCLEAMACSRAVVAANTGGLPEALRDGHEGVLVKPEDPEALAGALSRLLQDGDERRRLGEAARRRVLSSFAAPVVAEQTAQLYDEARRCGSGS